MLVLRIQEFPAFDKKKSEWNVYGVSQLTELAGKILR